MLVMNELAPLYALDPTAAQVCGLLHDAAKELPLEAQLVLARKGNVSLNTPCDEHPMFLHGPAGACYITQELGIQDPIILDTIARHTYFGSGVAFSPVFCWCLRFADVLEAGRSWKELHRPLQPLVYSGNLREGAYLITEWLIPFLGTKSIPVHPNVHRVLNELSSLMKTESGSDPDRLPV
jgi:HD superfamily phosphohydrolase YqeK